MWSNFFFPEWFIISHSRSEMLHLFFSVVPSFSALSRREAPSKSSQGFTLCFQLLFPFVWSSFCYRSSSWRLYMMAHQRLLLVEFKYLRSFFQFFSLNCAFATFIFNSYGGLFKIPLPMYSYQFIHSFQSRPVIRWRPSQVCSISILILSTRISSMPNPLLVINLYWWRMSIT